MLQYLDYEFNPLMEFLISRGLGNDCLAESVQFRTVFPESLVPDDWEYMPDYIGVPKVSTNTFNDFGKQGVVFSLPSQALCKMENADCYLRGRGGKKGLTVCRAPHLFIGASWGNAAGRHRRNCDLV